MSTGDMGESELEQAELADVIKHLLYLTGPLFAVKIQKLVFFIELRAIEEYKTQLTRADFKPTMYGGYSEDIRKTLDELEGEVITKYGIRKGKKTLKYDYEKPVESLNEDQQEIIENVVDEYGTQDIDELTQLSKDNWLFSHAEYGEEMDFKAYLSALEKGDANPVTVDHIDSVSTASQNL